VKKLIAFDLDGTLAPSKSPMTDRMSEAFAELLDRFQVCVISGGNLEQFHKQLLNSLRVGPDKLANLHLMPTCGTRYYRYDKTASDWQKVYAEDLTDAQKQQISHALNKGIDDLGYREEKTFGECIEDRGSQVTFSILGQDIVDVLGLEGVAIKEAWDPDNRKKNELRDYIAPLIPEFEVRVGGLTSIDVTQPGIDKAYGLKKLMEALDIKKEDILFLGDRIQEGGNDYPVKLMGVDCLEVSRWEDTVLAIEAIMHVL
jgi:HAD superfamily hydrolase (TIGR01484 family)